MSSSSDKPEEVKVNLENIAEEPLEFEDQKLRSQTPKIAKKKKKMLKKKKKRNTGINVPNTQTDKKSNDDPLEDLPETNFNKLNTNLSRSQGKRTVDNKALPIKSEEQSNTVSKEPRAKSHDTRNLRRRRVRKQIPKDRMDSDEYNERDTNQFGLIKEHKDPWTSGTYSIGKVIGSGMIGVCCLCQDESNNLLYCLKHMSIEKIREKNLFKNIKEEVEIMYDLIGVKGVC